MPRPLSVDLRKRIIAAIDDGMKIGEAAKLFDVCEKAIYNWINLRKIINSLEPKSGYQKGHSHKIKNWEEFRAFAAANKHCTIKAMQEKWQKNTNAPISKSVIQRGLKKIDYTSKKKLLVIKRQMQKNVNNF
jgi:transposase